MLRVTTVSDTEITQHINDAEFPQVTLDGLPRVSSVISRTRNSLARQHIAAKKILADPNSNPEDQKKAQGFVDFHGWRSFIGDQVHAKIAEGLKQETILSKDWLESDDSLEDVSKAKVRLFQNFYRQNAFTLLRSPDSRISSDVLQLAGTPDIPARRYGENVILDIKIGSKVHLSNIMQLTAYKLLLQEKMGITVHRVGIILLGARRSVKGKKMPAYDLRIQQVGQKQVEKFKRLLDIWHTEHPNTDQLVENAHRYYANQAVQMPNQAEQQATNGTLANVA